MLSENSNSDLKKAMKVKNEATSQSISKSAYSIFVLLVAIAIGVAVSSIDRIPSSPVVQLKNGSYYGVHVPEYNTYHFLGMPYAKAPVGNLRYRPPESLNSTWTGVHSATEYGYSCMGYGEDTYDALNNYVNEDCLTLNVIKPAILEAHPPLPVLVWIHGGGFAAGGSSDMRYNLTFLVEQSVQMNKPIISVSLNYRLSGFGFLWSKDIVDAGVANLGLRDQRLGLHWIKENIAAFGGDPSKVTIWGESAGGNSIASQLLAYNGRDDKIFRGAISVSGSLVGFGPMNADPNGSEDTYQELLGLTGCKNSSDRIECLRESPYKILNEFFNGSMACFDNRLSLRFAPLPDGDFVVRDALSQVNDGAVPSVPYLLGDTSDEGTAFAPFGLNTEEDIFDFLSATRIPQPLVKNLLLHYSVDSPILIPEAYQSQLNTTIGIQWKRVSTILTDLLMVAPRRYSARKWAELNKSPIYNFRFNAVPNGVDDVYSAVHFVDIPYTFHNIEGTGFPDENGPWRGPNPFDGKAKGYYDLARLVARMWISFTSDLDPNLHGEQAPVWEPYTLERPSQIVFNGETPTYVTTDNLRGDEVDFVIQEVLRASFF
ncbi:hypothetical protein N7467_000657 [Penicillium canescens]|nr:hypothetical protein N7467_000657 [Penicillium canescens]